MLKNKSNSRFMHDRLLRCISVALLLFFAIPDGYAQKKTKRRPAPARHTNRSHPPSTPAPTVDIKAPGPATVPVPQERSLTPKMEKTRKVVIVPAPPPPPGKDPMPPYPKR
jgi:hypothetical protein